MIYSMLVAVQNSMLTGVVVVNNQGELVYVNRAFCGLTGQSEEELLRQKHPASLWTKEDLPEIQKAVDAVTSGNSNGVCLELRLCGKRGERFDAWAQFSRVDLGKKGGIGWVACLQDISPRKQKERDLEWRKGLLEAMLECSPDGVLVVDGSGRMQFFNKRFVEMWGISQEIVATRSDDLALEAVLGKLVNPQSFLERVTYLYDHPLEDSRDEIQLKDGRVFGRFSTPVRDDEGRYLGRMWFFHDLTGSRWAETIRDAKLKAQRAVV